MGATSEERRVVTVVFADLVGYSGLAEHLDPEQVKRLIDGAFEHLVEDIVSFGGRVDRILGDGILAMFGAPVAHEDDADRAIRAALCMHQSLAAYVSAREGLDQPLALRIGVNTGEVLVGRVAGTDTYTAMGDVVNVASRLQTMAAPGEVFIGDATAALASEAISRELVADSGLRGRDQTERVWRVTGSNDAVTDRGRRDLPFVGRHTQRALFSSIMSAVAAGRSAVVAVSGAAGVGKTRLVAEMLDEFPDPALTLISGVCVPYGENNAWAPIAGAFVRRLQLETRGSPDRIRTELSARAVERLGLAAEEPALGAFVEVLMHLLGHPSELDALSPAQARERVFRVVIATVRRRAAVGPVVLWFDDLQWADPLVLDVLVQLTRALVDQPVLFVTAQRDEVELDWPPAEDHPITVRMPLDALNRDEADALVAAVFGEPPSDAVAGQLYERSGGNPLFLTELADLARSHPDATELPGTLRALIAARLDRLPTGQRAILDNAAVLGTSGLVESLQNFAAKLGQSFERSDLDRLVVDGMLDVEGDRWRFRTDVVREVVYQTLTKVVRARRHAGTAEVKAQLGNSPIDEIAHHAATAAELVGELGSVEGVPRNIDQRAARLLLDAARRALETGAFTNARRQATRALDLMPRDAHLVRELLILRAEAGGARHLIEVARRDAEEALTAALEDGDRRHEGIARRLIGTFEQAGGHLDAARVELDASIEIFRQLEDETELANSLSDRGFIEVFGGPLRDAERFLAEADELFERLDDHRGRGWVRQHQAWVSFLGGDADAAEARIEQAAVEFDRLGDRDGTAWVDGLRAYLRYYQGRVAEAEDLAMRVRESAVASGDRWAMAMMDALLAGIRLWAGRFVEAEQLSRRALSGFRALSDRFGVVLASAPAMRAMAALGRMREAEQAMEEVMALGEGYGELSFPMMAAAGTAVHLGLGQRAVVVGEIAVARTEAMGADGTEARVTLALALCQCGRVEEAMTVLLDVESDRPYAAAVHAVAAALSGDGAAAIEAADRVTADRAATYLDRVLADVAAAAAEHHAGERAAASARLRRARGIADRAGDVVAGGVVGGLEDMLMRGGLGDDLYHLGAGWHCVIEALCTPPA